jgi:hypothetical protein
MIAGTSTGGLLALYLASRGQTSDALGEGGLLGLKGDMREQREGESDPAYYRKVKTRYHYLERLRTSPHPISHAKLQ